MSAMDTDSLIMIVALVVLVILSGYFSATETAFSSLNRVRLRTRAEEGDKRAQLALELEADYDRLLSTILIGNNIVNIVATTIATLLFTKLLGSYGPTVSTIVLTVVILIFGEISPKSLAKENAESFAMFSAPILRIFLAVLRPLNFIFTQWKKLLSRIFRKSEDQGITEAELITMVEQAEDEGGLKQEESELIRAAIEFHDLEVREILTPRVDIIAIEDTAPMEEIAHIFAESGYSRLPVYHEDMDDIVGILLEKDFHAARAHGIHDVAAIMSPALCATEGAKISDLLRILQRKKAHMMIVVDEYGGTAGLVTMEDIVEELVGEIWDEHDEVVELFRKQEDGSYLISCTADLSDLLDLFTLRDDDTTASTISGWVMERIGRVPEPGDRFVAENLDVTVTKVEHRRVMEIKVVVLEPDKTT